MMTQETAVEFLLRARRLGFTLREASLPACEPSRDRTSRLVLNRFELATLGDRELELELL